jgi:hypothetical protein
MFTTPRTLAALAATLIIAASTSSAMAGSKHHGRHHGFHHRGHVQLFIGGGGGGCGYYRNRWQDTGSFYWKRRYFECRGWW